MERINNRFIWVGFFFVGLFFLNASNAFSQQEEIKYFNMPEFRINVFYSEPTDDQSILIYLDGKLKDSTLIRDLSSGKHSLKCVKAGFFDYEEEFSFPAKDTVTCVMAKTTTLSISVTDTVGNRIDAKIYLDDRFQGIASDGSYPVRKGTHTVKCSKDGYEDYVESINIEKHVAMRGGSYYNVNCLLKPFPGTVVGQGNYVPTPTPMQKPKGFFAGFWTWLASILKGWFRK